MSESDEVIAIKVSGQIIRSSVAEVPAKGRDTMGVKFVGVAAEDAVAVIALNPEAREEVEAEIAAGENPEATVEPATPGSVSSDRAEEENGD